MKIAIVLLLIGVLWGGLLYAQATHSPTPAPSEVPLPSGWPTPHTIVPSPVATPTVGTFVPPK
jgi:hypothetical protein